MFPIRVPTANIDRTVSKFVVDHADPATERVLSVATWGADEHLLVAAAATFWLFSRRSSRATRTASLHLLVLSVVSSRLPKLAKRGLNQLRPDRLTSRGHARGIGFSGQADDAFPSGHSVHMGALASAALDFPPALKAAALAGAIALSLSRIAILAHWTSDVAVGFIGGFMTERLLRRWTGYPTVKGSKVERS
jgi:membrane-associated phospholipid phosphatase